MSRKLTDPEVRARLQALEEERFWERKHQVEDDIEWARVQSQTMEAKMQAIADSMEELGEAMRKEATPAITRVAEKFHQALRNKYGKKSSMEDPYN